MAAVLVGLAALIGVAVTGRRSSHRGQQTGSGSGAVSAARPGAADDHPPSSPPPSSPGRTSPTTVAASPERLEVSVIGATLPTGLSRAAAVADGTSLVVLGGLQADHRTTPAVLRIDPTTGTASTRGPLPIATHDAAAVRLGSSVLVFGGGAGSVTDVVQQVDASGLARIVGHLPSPRADLRAVVVGDRAVIVGGYDGHRSSSTVLSTTDGMHFSTVATLARAVRYPAVAVVGEKVYVFGGEDGGAPVADVQVVDVATGTAGLAGRLPEPRGEAAAVAGGDKVWVVGGRTPASIVGSIVRWDTSTDVAAPAGALASPVADAAPVEIGDTTYLVGGENATEVAQIVAARPR